MAEKRATGHQSRAGRYCPCSGPDLHLVVGKCTGGLRRAGRRKGRGLSRLQVARDCAVARTSAGCGLAGGAAIGENSNEERTGGMSKV